MKKLLIVPIVLCLILAACEKDNEEKASKTDLLTGKIWIHDAEMQDSNNNMVPDDGNNIQKEITYKFNNDGTMNFTYKQTSKILEWELIQNESVLKIEGNMYDSILPPAEATLHPLFQLDEDTLIFFYESTATNPDTGTFEIFRD